MIIYPDTAAVCLMWGWVDDDIHPCEVMYWARYAIRCDV